MRGRWLVGSIVALLVAAIFVSLGLWQLARHHHEHYKVRAERAAYAAPAPSLDGSTAADGSRVEVRGTYDRAAAHETLLRDQLHNGDAGVDVLTPVLLTDGTAVVVDRGWVATGDDVSSPPAGVIVVRGVVHEPRANSTQSPVVRAGTRLSVARVDLDRIGRGLPYRLRDDWI